MIYDYRVYTLEKCEPMPAAGVCISPWVDLEGTGESMTSKG